MTEQHDIVALAARLDELSLQRRIVDRQMAGIDADIAVVRGKMATAKGEAPIPPDISPMAQALRDRAARDVLK